MDLYLRPLLATCFVAVIVGGVVLTCVDCKRRTGRIIPWRVIVAFLVLMVGLSIQYRGEVMSIPGSMGGFFEFAAFYSGGFLFTWYVLLRPRNAAAQQTKAGSRSIAWEFLLFVKHEKKWWLIPLISVLLLVGALIVFAGSSPLAPFIYPLF